MAKEADKLKLQTIASVIKSGQIERMKQLETLYPTLVSKALKLNHSRYVDRLYYPEQFTIKQIRQFAALLDLPPQTLVTIILKQPIKPKAPKKKK